MADWTQWTIGILAGLAFVGAALWFAFLPMLYPKNCAQAGVTFENSAAMTGGTTRPTSRTSLSLDISKNLLY